MARVNFPSGTSGVQAASLHGGARSTGASVTVDENCVGMIDSSLDMHVGWCQTALLERFGADISVQSTRLHDFRNGV